MTDDGAPVGNPTYMGDIRKMIRPVDIEHMLDPNISGGGIQLGTYEGVRANALRIYFRVKEKSMPPDRPWSDAWVETFYNWMRNGYPRGQGEPVALAMLSAPSAAGRVRRNLKDLSGPEKAKVKAAFAGMMNRDPGDPQSYFALAGIHWLPGGGPAIYYCRHHENAYNPWHRAYMLRFEDAMRSVPGCEDVTLPYWDITDPDIPPILWEEPFESYEVPLQLCPLEGACYPPAGSSQKYRTDRYPPAQVWQNLIERKVPDLVKGALANSWWELFDGWDGDNTHRGIISAHDSGHNSCGTTMQNQDVSAFDPIFWFFHCNWDRLWWKWQQTYGATTLTAFKTHLQGVPDWLDDPVLNLLPPFELRTRETIDLTSLDVDYEHPLTEAVPQPRPALVGSLPAGRSFDVSPRSQVSVRVKDVNRLEIPGSFDVSLWAGDKLLGKIGLFQPTTPKRCATCRKSGLASFDFLVDQADLASGPVHAEITLLARDGSEVPFSAARAGNPTINARLLLQE